MGRKKLLKNEVIKLFNTTSETLRHYEKKGLLKPEIDDNNYRLYDFEDIQTLRQIFLLKDLELSIEEMGQLQKGDLQEKDYLKMLKNHDETLKSKIERLTQVQNHIQQLVKLIENSDGETSYKIHGLKERHFYVLDPIEVEVMESPKVFYDKFESVIRKDSYSEKYLFNIYKYEELTNGREMTSNIAIELPEPELHKEMKTLTAPAGRYLSVFYHFNHDSFNTLPEFKKEIDVYLKKNNLLNIGAFAIELEHPELSLFTEEGAAVFELQLLVEKG